MMTTATTATLPKGMALVETPEGRWFAAFAPKAEKPHWVFLLEDAATTLIPPALEPLDDPCRGYECREGAIEAYLAWHEAALLPIQCQILATHSEVYPERNAWYLDEITRLTGDEKPRFSCGTDVYAVVIAVCDGNCEAITATGSTPDEAIEALYQHVYEWFWRQQRVQQLAS